MRSLVQQHSTLLLGWSISKHGIMCSYTKVKSSAQNDVSLRLPAERFRGHTWNQTWLILSLIKLFLINFIRSHPYLFSKIRVYLQLYLTPCNKTSFRRIYLVAMKHYKTSKDNGSRKNVNKIVSTRYISNWSEWWNVFSSVMNVKRLEVTKTRSETFFQSSKQRALL